MVRAFAYDRFAMSEVVVLPVSSSQDLAHARELFVEYAASIGFSLALILFAGIRERIEGADVPTYFKGTAIALVTGGLMSLAFMGFAGLDKYQ